jgi:hypothetical protein
LVYVLYRWVFLNEKWAILSAMPCDRLNYHSLPCDRLNWHTLFNQWEDMKYNNTGCRTSSVLNLSHVCHLLWNPVTFWTKLCRMMYLGGSTKIPHFIFMRQIKHENKRNCLLLISKICKTILSFGTIKSIESKVCRNLVVDPHHYFLLM